MDVSNGDNRPNGDSGDFGKVIDELHSKQKLSSLRTYQGDMAQFIKDKNESVISIAVKEKEKKEKIEEKKVQTGEIKLSTQPKKSRFKQNMIMVMLSLILLAGGFMGFLYIIELIRSGPAPEAYLEESVIPYNQSVNIVLASGENLKSELSKTNLGSGITLVKISGMDGLPIEKARDFFGFLQVSLPFNLSRVLKDDYALAAISQDGEAYPFIVIKVGDFGGAFAGMLDWEDKIKDDLSFLGTIPSLDMTSLVASSSVPVAKEGPFAWKDIIVKNKDTRGLVDNKGKSKIAYTFLDKNTLLIVTDIYSIGEISSIYASRSVAR